VEGGRIAVGGVFVGVSVSVSSVLSVLLSLLVEFCPSVLFGRAALRLKSRIFTRF
jgi:hypothetical protein